MRFRRLLSYTISLCLITASAAGEQVLDKYEVGDGTYVRALHIVDEEGRLWVGTSAGVLEIDLETHGVMNTFTREHGLANEYVFAIGADRDRYIWFGTNAGGASRYRSGQWQTFFPMHGLADYWVYAFSQHEDGNLWIGTWAGASKVNLDTLSFTNYRDELINEWVYGIDIDSQGRVWFGTEGGVSMYDGENWKHWTHSDGLGASNDRGLPPSDNTGLGTRSRHDLSVLRDGAETFNPNYVFAMHVDKEDNIWAGTWGGGVSRFDGRSWKNFTRSDGLAGNIVYSIGESADGSMWFGTDNGLSHYDGKTWLNFSKDDGLLGKDVYAIAVSNNNDIWIGTKNGVVRIGNVSTE